MRMTINLVIFRGFCSCLVLLGIYQGPPSCYFAGQNSADIEALNESLHDLLDGIQVMLQFSLTIVLFSNNDSFC